ncbi:MAG: DUF305 domain-containing protein, partial [Actinobacteria bacterium]|nr:DUF305 domain-containing protein [Actinomycetota bacterium]
KKSGGFIAIIVALIAVIVFLAFNRSDDNFMNNMGHSNGNTNQNSSNEFIGSDLMFAEMMIPHHEQAVEMADLALNVSKDADILALAREIRDAQAPEILQMEKWLDVPGMGTGMGTGMGHSMGMGDMLSDSEMRELKNSTGKSFDQLFLKGMIAHHEGAIHMTLMIKDSRNAEVKALGKNIVTSQTAEIETMKEMLKQY